MQWTLETNEYLLYKEGKKDIISVKRRGSDIYRGDLIQITEVRKEKNLVGEIGLFEVVSQSVYDRKTKMYTLRIHFVRNPEYR